MFQQKRSLYQPIYLQQKYNF